MPADYALLVCSQKGGVGKTSVALNLAAALSSRGPVTLLDADPLHCVGGCVNLTNLVHSSADLTNLNGSWSKHALQSQPELIVLVSPDGGVPNPESMRAALESITGGLAVIDSPPLADLGARELLGAVSGTLIIEAVDPWCMRTLPLALEALLNSRAAGHNFDFLGVLPVCMRGDADEPFQAEFLRERFGENIRPETLPYEPGLSAAQLEGKPLMQTMPKCAYMQALEQIAQGIIEQV